jgi:peroxiredoxin
MTTAHDLPRSGTGARVADQAFTHLIDRNAPWLRMVAPGDRLPIRPLVEVDLGPIHLDRLLRTGPVVLLFIRYATSPECAAALRDYRDTLAPALALRDAHLVAVSPQVPDRLASLKRGHDLDFLVAADPRHALIDALNIGFGSPGADVVLGARRAVLPFAAAVVADRAGVVRLAEVRPNWSEPIAPEQIIAAVPA